MEFCEDQPEVEEQPDYQGGKEYGEFRERQARTIDGYNQELLNDGHYKDIESLEEKLEAFKEKFIALTELDEETISVMEFKQMLEDLGEPRTHVEVMKMLRRVMERDANTRIGYKLFLSIMLRPSDIRQLIMLFEELMKQAGSTNPPKGPPPKKSISELP